jgi:hypothetical protein
MRGLSEEQNDALRTLYSSPIALVIGAVVIAMLALLCLSVALLLRPDETADSVTPPPPPMTTPGPPFIDEGDVLVVGMSDATPISVTLSAPTMLAVGDRSWSVQTQTIPVDGTWSPAIPDATTAVWVYGTVVNYVIGLADTTDNRLALEQLTPGDEMTLRMGDGVAFTFAFNSRRNVLVTGRDVFNQQSPGLTLVLVGSDGGERLVVYGRYLVTESDSLDIENTVDLGETVQLDGLQFTVTGAAYVFDRPEIPSGFAFYLVDYQAQNVAGTVFNSNLLRLTLADDLGNQYAFNPVASQIGNHPPLGGTLNPNQTLMATAGYQIPAGLSSPTLRWQVTRTDTNNQVQVSIPFRDRQEQAQQASVSLTQAEVSLDGSSLLLVGQLTNLGNETLAVQEGNISLTSDGSVYLILSTSPGFPWLIAPGQTVQFSVTFQRPTGSTAVFTVLNQPFELTGLR